MFAARLAFGFLSRFDRVIDHCEVRTETENGGADAASEIAAGVGGIPAALGVIG
jgi:hypothetical protein